MPAGDRCWVEYSELLRKRMFQDGVPEITVPMEEIHADTKTDVSFAELRRPGYWNPCRDAAKDWDTFQKNGIELDFEVESDGCIHFVTFRLDARRRATMERFQNRA